MGSPVRAPKTPFPSRELPREIRVTTRTHQVRPFTRPSVPPPQPPASALPEQRAPEPQEARLRTRSKESVTCVSKTYLCIAQYRITYQVVAEELHDQSAVLVALLAQCIQLCIILRSESFLLRHWLTRQNTHPQSRHQRPA